MGNYFLGTHCAQRITSVKENQPKMLLMLRPALLPDRVLVLIHQDNRCLMKALRESEDTLLQNE